MSVPFVPATETVDARYGGLDTWSDAAILGALVDGQRRAVDSVAAVLPALSRAAQAGAQALGNGGRLVYIAAGSPALIAMGDALEIPQTYGIARNRIVLILAGGDALITDFAGGPEDDGDQARTDVLGAGVGAGDCVISISASGTTAYTVSGQRAAKASGARTIAIAGNAGSPLLEESEIPICLETGAEVISGSTRLAAGTAQKAVLNMLSTLIGVRLGHVHENFMVNLTADNAKLIGRATAIVARVTGCDGPTAARSMQEAGNSVKPAILLAAGAMDLSEAARLLAASGGVVRVALEKLSAR